MFSGQCSSQIAKLQPVLDQRYQHQKLLRPQVRHAQHAGAAAAIVYDNTYEPLIIMSKPAGHASPGIPAVFISQKSGIIMKKLMTPGVTVAHIMPVHSQAVLW